MINFVFRFSSGDDTWFHFSTSFFDWPLLKKNIALIKARDQIFNRLMETWTKFWLLFKLNVDPIGADWIVLRVKYWYPFNGCVGRRCRCFDAAVAVALFDVDGHRRQGRRVLQRSLPESHWIDSRSFKSLSKAEIFKQSSSILQKVAWKWSTAAWNSSKHLFQDLKDLAGILARILLDWYWFKILQVTVKSWDFLSNRPRSFEKWLENGQRLLGTPLNIFFRILRIL